MAWQSYKELIVWQKSMDLVDEVYRLINKLPKEELYALSDQMRRSAISIPSNIAESHGRQSAKEFRRFLSISKGSASELETQLLICIRQNYLSEQQVHTALSLCDEISRMLAKLISNANIAE
ncbi:MAG: four helix bundle protein [Ruminococcus sp.]